MKGLQHDPPSVPWIHVNQPDGSTRKFDPRIHRLCPVDVDAIIDQALECPHCREFLSDLIELRHRNTNTALRALHRKWNISSSILGQWLVVLKDGGMFS